MTVVAYTKAQYKGLSSDTKPTSGVPEGAEYYATDTDTWYQWTGSTWVGAPGSTTGYAPILVAGAGTSAATQAAALASGGAICDGTIDDTEIQAGITALTASRTWIETVKLIGTFNPTVSITIPSYTKLDLTDATFAWDYADILFEATGTLGTSTTLTGNAAIGATALSVTDQSIVVAGDYVLIRSESTLGGFKDGEIHRVVSVSAGVINIDSGLWLAYTTANTATAQKVNMVTDVEVAGGIVVGTSATQVKDVDVLNFTYTTNFAVHGMSIKNISRRGLVFSSSVRGSVHHNQGYGIAQAGYGYGIATVSACNSLDIHDNHFFYCRHSYTGGGLAGVYGVPMYCKVNDNIFKGSTDSAIDMHGCNSWGMSYDNNIVSGLTSCLDIGGVQWSAKGNHLFCYSSTGYAITDRDDVCKYVTLYDNTVSSKGSVIGLDSTALLDVDIDGLHIDGQLGDGYAVYIVPAATAIVSVKNVKCYSGNTDLAGIYINGGAGHYLSGNELRLIRRAGIWSAGASFGIISNNQLYKVGYAGAADYGYNGITIASNYLQVFGNNIYDDTNTQVYGIQENGTADYNQIHDNQIDGAQTSPILLVGSNTKLHNNFVDGARYLVDDEEVVLKVSVTHADTSVAIATVPAGSFVTAEVWVNELFNPGTSDTFTVGYTADPDSIVTNVDVSSTGRKAIVYGIEGGYMGTARIILAYYTPVGTAPTTGHAVVVLRITKSIAP